MDTTPLPTIDIDLSDNDSGTLVDYILRVTSYEKFTFEKFKTYIADAHYVFRYVLSREVDTGNEHFHVVLSVDSSFTEEDLRADVRSFLVPFWQSSDFKLPRGFGNKQYNLQICKDLDKAVSYCVKLNEYVYENFDDEYIIQRKEESFLKKKTSNFKSEYLELVSSFQQSDMDIRQFMISYANLKAKYGQQISLHHAYGYAISNVILRDNNAEDFVENFLYKQ